MQVYKYAVHTHGKDQAYKYACRIQRVNGLLWARQNGLPPTPDTLHLGCSYSICTKQFTDKKDILQLF